MTVIVVQKQRKIKLDISYLKRQALVLTACAQANVSDRPPWREVVIHLLDNRQMCEVNRAVMRHEGVTDVITQRYDPLPGEANGLIGELFVNVERAFQKAPMRKGWSADLEILLYIAHGCDHLTGADDQTPEDRRRMRRRELRWLKTLPAPNSRVKESPRNIQTA